MGSIAPIATGSWVARGRPLLGMGGRFEGALRQKIRTKRVMSFRIYKSSRTIRSRIQGGDQSQTNPIDLRSFVPIR